MKYKLASSRL